MASLLQSGGAGREAVLVQRLFVGIAIVVVGLLLGRLIPENSFLPAALLVGFALMFLLLRRPLWFLMLGIFFYYGALRILDTEVVGRVAGLFRLKDVFLVMMLLHIIATQVISRRRNVVPGDARAFRYFLLFMAWITFQMWRTVVLTGEEKMLMFRVGRHFLTYGFFLFLLYYLQSDDDWKKLNRFLHGLAYLTIGLGVLTALGVNTTIYPRGADLYGRFAYGVFKFYNPAESLVYAMFIYNFWRYCFRPTWKNGLAAVVMAGGCTFFIFRARLAGMALGMLVSLFFAPARVRGRAVVVGLVVAISAAIVLSAFGLVAASVTETGGESYLGSLADYFNEAVRGVTQRDTGDVLIRQIFIQMRWSMVKKNPWAGIGFVSPFGKVGWNMYRLGDMPVGHVDVGWLDALMRLGVIGSVILSLFLISAAVEGRKLLAVNNLSEEDYAFGLTSVSYVVLMFVSTYSFSYPTWEEPILTFSLIFGWLMRVRRRLKESPAPEGEDRALHRMPLSLSAGRLGR